MRKKKRAGSRRGKKKSGARKVAKVRRRSSGTKFLVQGITSGGRLVYLGRNCKNFYSSRNAGCRFSSVTQAESYMKAARNVAVRRRLRWIQAVAA